MTGRETISSSANFLALSFKIQDLYMVSCDTNSVSTGHHMILFGNIRHRLISTCRSMFYKYSFVSIF